MTCVVFFFKQKTAYEMRISDWSSDVCSSDLLPSGLGKAASLPARRHAVHRRLDPDLEDLRGLVLAIELSVHDAAAGRHHLHVARLGAADVAQVVLVGDGVAPHISDDLHVAVAGPVAACATPDGVFGTHT